MLSGDDVSSCDDGRGIHSTLHSSSWEYMGHHTGNHNGRRTGDQNGRRSGGDDRDKGPVEGSSKLRKNTIQELVSVIVCICQNNGVWVLKRKQYLVGL